jgi:membrane fusion protein (multidrug efflux system)
MYVRVQLEQARATNAILLPQQAVTRAGTGDTVLVVDAQGHVQPRPVKVGGAQEGQWIILEGLKAGEQVIVDGVMKLAMMPPGAPVKAVPWKPGAPGASPGGTAAGAGPGAPAAGGQAPAAKASEAKKS